MRPLPESTCYGNGQLAIIMSRSRPQEFPAEIGILVQIYGQSKATIETEYRKVIDGQNKQTNNKELPRPVEKLESPVYHYQILQHVKIPHKTISSSDSVLHAERTRRT